MGKTVQPTTLDGRLKLLSNVRIRVESPADRDGIFDVHHRAFGQTNESRLVDALRPSDAFIPALSLVAEAAGSVVGHVVFSEIVIRGERDRPALALAPMGVLPEYQRQGIGSAMVRRGLEEATRLGHRRVIVVGHAEYYPRFGFRPASKFGIRAPFEVPDPAFLALALTTGGLEGCEGTVHYPAAFQQV